MGGLRRALLVSFLLLCCLGAGVLSDLAQDKAGLLAFLDRTPHENRIQWNASASPCDWTGVSCDANRSQVIALRLPGVGLVGPIPPNTLSRVSGLRVLSLRANRLSGPLPVDLSGLSFLRSLYLQGNRLSGELPAAVGRLTRLTRLDLSANNFTGTIPFALNNLTRLTGLFLEDNGFSGSLPSIDIPGMNDFNVSNNQLNGSIPSPLQRFPPSSFAGNLDLCGGPLAPCSPFFPSPAPAPEGGETPVQGPVRKKRKLSTAAIVAISVGAGVVLLLALLLCLICLAYRRRRRDGQPVKPPKAGGPAVPGSLSGPTETATTSSSKDDVGGGPAEGEKNKLVFFENGLYSFDLEDLLRASAEVLGKGSVGTSYKAVLEEGTTVVVKRLKDVAVPKRDFELQMEALGKGKHENVVPLRAFYFSKDEKLLVYDYLSAGSLSALLHVHSGLVCSSLLFSPVLLLLRCDGAAPLMLASLCCVVLWGWLSRFCHGPGAGSRGSGRTPLDWDNRMRIALAAGRGLAYLHTVAKLVHGNVKASNVLLRPDPDAAAVSDYGLSPLFGTAAPPNRVAGYRAPEVLETRRPTFKSDVYSFGVLLLELLTGKAPNQASLGEEGIDLPRWVQSVVREEWTAEVFDVELMRYQNIEEEMVQVLQMAMACVQNVPDARPEIQEVVRMLEDVVNRGEGDDGLRQSSDDPSKGGSGGPTPPAATTP
ncbi:hypothetical protein Taro_033554 [Colocasia esculenta]|uniref:Protein kinase domain-containing protein n=1 Tax=Colocasia esculenta TaxID=4460 RepID=A0A843W528_COLES|nr:hypothetical protein [Colocasia esculenta]